MNCLACAYRKNIPLFSKCAGISGRSRVGNAHYCGHPDMSDPVPLININENVHKECPICKDDYKYEKCDRDDLRQANET